jgi:hypothetical protein
MSIFAIIAHTRPDIVGTKVKELYPDNYALSPSAWFFTDTITTAEARKKFLLDEGKLGAQAVVVQIDGWSGYAPSDLWEWFKIRLEPKPNG